ncbi:MAG TPA: YfhO family protein, partial [Anaerolineae bacterium]|nr:YfhO family protein [Anaerolineae bacterium]
HSSSPPTFQPSNLPTFHPSTPQSLSLSVSTPTPALLVLSEPYYPGWQATVDGQSAPILRANYLLRAIPVPAGEHRIELVFQPWSFTLGAIISLLTLIAVSVTLVLIRRRSQK